MEKQLAIPFGILDFYKNYVTFLVTCDRINRPIAVEILRHTDSYFEGRPYVFISNRVFSSRIDPEAYSAVNPNQLIGVAIVSEIDENVSRASAEKSYYDGAFAVFKNMDEAKVWADQIVENLAD